MGKLAVFFLSFYFFQATAQNTAASGPGSVDSEDSLYNIYYTGRQEQFFQLYNGRQFYGYPPSIEGHAFYLLNDWFKGTVVYDGLEYRDIQMMYDIYRDELVVRHPIGIPVILYSNRVQQFSFMGHTFVYLKVDKDGVSKNGFFQQLTSGRAIVYARRIKLLDEKIDNLKLERKFIPADAFYIMKDKQFFPISKQPSIFNALKDKRQAMLQYKSKLGLKFRKDPETFVLRMTEYYNQINP